MADEDPRDAPPTEQQRVEAWRMERLIDAGFPGWLASRLACVPEVDVNQATRMLAQGCDPLVALEILL